jgi:hypothetical protein
MLNVDGIMQLETPDVHVALEQSQPDRTKKPFQIMEIHPRIGSLATISVRGIESLSYFYGLTPNTVQQYMIVCAAFGTSSSIDYVVIMHALIRSVRFPVFILPKQHKTTCAKRANAIPINATLRWWRQLQLKWRYVFCDWLTRSDFVPQHLLSFARLESIVCLGFRQVGKNYCPCF